MADSEMQRRPQNRQYTWLWMIIAFVFAGALLVWLAVSSEPTQVAVVEEDPAATGDQGSAVPAVALDQFAANPEEYAGQAVRLDGIEVASAMGTQAMWVNLPGGIPYLVKFDTVALGAPPQVASGDLVMVSGTVHPMTDSVLSAWQATGAIQGEGQLAQAQFATSFLEATQARRSTGGGGAGGPGGAGGGTGAPAGGAGGAGAGSGPGANPSP